MIVHSRSSLRLFHPITALVAVAAGSAALSACSVQPREDDGAVRQEAEIASALAADSSVAGLCCGQAETVVTGITEAENIRFSNEGRLFVSGNNGIFELTRDASGVVQSTNLAPGQSCDFSGMTQVGSVLYAACFDYKNSYLFAANLTNSPTTFTQIYELEGVILANGIDADETGRLYVAASFQGKILRLELSPGDPFTVLSQQTWLTTHGGLFPNGLKYSASNVYWTDSLEGSINRVAVLADGSPGPTFGPVDTGQFLDDFYVDSDGNVVVACDLIGSVRAYTPPPFGILYAQTPRNVFKLPSAVVPAEGRLGFSNTDLLVTDKGANSVVVYHVPAL